MKIILVLMLASLVLGCVQTQDVMEKKSGDAMEKNESVMEKNGTMEKNETMIKNESAMMKKGMYQGAVLAGSVASVLDFKKADYDTALQSNKTILLYFYADWCPICRVEVPELYAAFNELTTDKIIAFRVNFNDGNVDADERALAEQFGVPYQHTKVILKDGKAVLKSPEGWTKSRYLSEINKVL